MKRYEAFGILAAISVASFAAGWAIGIQAATDPPSLQPATLNVTTTLHGARGTVRASYSALTFGTVPPGLLVVDYLSDRVFCDGMQGTLACWDVRP